jgi:hypothetical protein
MRWASYAHRQFEELERLLRIGSVRRVMVRGVLPVMMRTVVRTMVRAGMMRGRWSRSILSE